MKARRLAVPLVVLLLALNIAHAKPKKPEVPAVFQTAKYVYVQAEDGDILKPSLYPEDRQAIYDVQNKIRDWNRYTITINRDEADLVFIVRKGRLASAQGQGGIGNIPRPLPGQNPSPSPGQGPGAGPGPNQGGMSEAVGMGTEVGPSDDLLRVFSLDGDKKKLVGPVWSRELDRGLDAPSMQLVQQLKDAVEKAYPPTPPSPPSNSNKP
jgi:hypothetical protein